MQASPCHRLSTDRIRSPLTKTSLSALALLLRERLIGLSTQERVGDGHFQSVDTLRHHLTHSNFEFHELRSQIARSIHMPALVHGHALAWCRRERARSLSHRRLRAK